MTYSFKQPNVGVVERETLAEISAAYVDYCSARPQVNHSSTVLRKDGDVVGYIHPQGNIFSAAKPAPLPLLFSTDPKASTGDVLVDALRSDELVDCLGMIRRVLNLPTTKTISDYFNTKDYETYRELLNCYRRAEFIKSWLAAELDAAAERIHGFPIERTTQR